MPHMSHKYPIPLGYAELQALWPNWPLCGPFLVGYLIVAFDGFMTGSRSTLDDGFDWFVWKIAMRALAAFEAILRHSAASEKRPVCPVYVQFLSFLRLTSFSYPFSISSHSTLTRLLHAMARLAGLWHDSAQARSGRSALLPGVE